MEEPEEVSLVQSHTIHDPERVTASHLMFLFFSLTTSILQSNGDTNTKCSALGAVARPTPPKPHVPTGATAAQLQIAGPGVPT